MDIDPNTWVERLLVDPQKWSSSPVIDGVSMGELRLLKYSDFLGVVVPDVPLARIRLLYRKSITPRNELSFDTSALQVAGGNGAMYQVASNFNCHEHAHAFVNVKSKEYLVKKMTDRTQGPSASAGAGAGAILRWRVNKDIREINLLENVPKYKVTNGKIVEIDYTQDYNPEEQLVGLHQNVTANFDRRNRRCTFYADGPTIDQVFVSTIKVTNPSEIKNCKELLITAYEHTYLCAQLRKTIKLVLTLIGGGVFRNPLHDIIDAIVSAHLKYSRGIDEVVLPLYDPNIDYVLFVKAFTKAKIPFTQVEA